MLNRRHIWKRFIRNRRGVVAVEMALIAPVMISMYLGTVELQDYFTVDRKLTTLTSTLADLVTQTNKMDNAEMANIFNASSTIMMPYRTSQVKMRVSVIDVPAAPGSPPTVYESRARNMAPLAKGSVYALPATLRVPGEQIVVSEVSLNYASPVGGFIMKSGISVNRKFYLKPRYGNIDWD